MARMNTVTRRALLPIITGLLTYARLQHAAAENDVNKNNRRRLSIAASYFSDDPTPDGVSWRNITQIVTADLKASDRFVLIEPDGSIAEKVDAVPQFDKWRGFNTEWLVTGRVTSAPNQRVKVEFRLWDVAKGEHVLGAQYWLGPAERRQVPHAMAEAILKRLSEE
jgi:TolB protein